MTVLVRPPGENVRGVAVGVVVALAGHDDYAIAAPDDE